MKRFYKEAKPVPTDLGWRVELDGRAVKTQGGAPQIVPGEAVARLLAGEWADQGETIDPSRFRHRDLVDFAIDKIAPDRAAAVAALLRYAETDTLCYLADPDEPLWRRQQEVWEPLLAACEAREAITLQRVSGIMHKPQSRATLETLERHLNRLDDLTLAALTTLTSLAASLVIGLSALEEDADPKELWAAANLEEQWQADLWGHDPEAEERRNNRKGDFIGAYQMIKALRDDRSDTRA